MSDATNLPFWDAVEAVIAAPVVLEAGDRLEELIGDPGGRPRLHHAYHQLVFHLICTGYYQQRVRRACTELGHPQAWAYVRQMIECHHPDRPELDPGPEPIRRHHVTYFKTNYLTSENGMAVVKETFERHAIQLARELGLCTGTTGGSWTLPSCNDVIQGDGKVVRPISGRKPGETWVDPLTGEIKQRRHDPDIGSYREGGQTTFTPGHKLTFLQTRTDEPGQRVVLGVEAGGDELASVTSMMDRVHPELPGAKVFAYDGALHGIHRTHFMDHYGMLCVSPPNGSKNDDVEPRWFKLGTAELHLPDGSTETVPIETFEGQPYLMEIGVDGSRVPIALEQRRVKHSRQRGRHRWYGYYSCDRGEIRIRFHPTAEDREMKLNRTERLHPYPIKSEVGRKLYGRRPDAESMNRQYEDACWQGRAPGYGRTTVLLGAIGWAFAQNLMTSFRLAKKNSPPGSAVAA